MVIGGVVWFNADKNATQGQVIAAKSAEALPEKRDGAVVVVGSEKAPVTIDVYADFLCPACQQFEQRDA
ncbi:MAG: thioredoxin domain-containing protein, partial [Thermocrispum sp.]